MKDTCFQKPRVTLVAGLQSGLTTQAKTIASFQTVVDNLQIELDKARKIYLKAKEVR